MKPPSPRGPLSSSVLDLLADRNAVPVPVTEAGYEDRMLTLWILHELHYRGFEGVDEDQEWNPELIAVRRELEAGFENELRELSAALVTEAEESGGDLVAQLELVTAHDGPTLTRYLHREATHEEYLDFLVQRSIYHLKESDPSAWLLPRLDGAAKVALAELLYDEYGNGVPADLHARLFADALEESGLDPTYGAYIDQTSAEVLAVNNAMSLFGLNRRLRAAGAGHLAAFEMTSSIPCRRFSQGADRLGLAPAVLRYFDEHVEADAVHEQLAARSICGALVAAEPQLRGDVLFGAASCVLLEEISAQATLDAWAATREERASAPGCQRPGAA